MRKSIVYAAIAAACVTGSSAALADVTRYQIMSINLYTDVGPGIDQHNYALSFNPCDGSFTGTGGDTVLGTSETLNGTIINNVLSATGVYLTVIPGYTFTYSATLGAVGQTVAGTTTAYSVDYPTNFTVTGISALTTYRNHGDFVKQSPDKNDAAHSCIGMPIQSQQGS